MTRDKLKVLRKFVGKLNFIAANTRPDPAIYALEETQESNNKRFERSK